MWVNSILQVHEL